MKILLLGPELRENDGGPSGVIYRLYNELLKTNDVKMLSLKKQSKVLSFFNIIKNCLNSKFDIINIHSGNTLPYFIIFLPKKIKTKIILTQHGYPKAEKDLKIINRLIHHSLTMLSLKCSYNISFVSKYLKNFILSDIKIDKSNLFLTPNGLDCNIRDFSFSESKDEAYIIFIGGSRWVKGFDLFINALLETKKRYKVRIFGKEGNLHQFYKDNETKLKIKHDIEYVGAVDKNTIYHELSKSSYCIIPSRFDTFNVVALEALFFKNIVLISKSAGASEIIIEKQNGFIIDPLDLNIYLTDLHSYFSDEITNNAYKTALEYLWINAVTKYLNMYNAVLSNNHNT